ncbi:MAG: PH domain-containing protein [Lachnospiraceae bacterium]|nr:PH domain-containing protein [Lachnospiraceae bacterium]
MAQFQESQQGGQTEKSKYSWLKQIVAIIAVVAVIALVFGRRSGKSTMKLSADDSGITMTYEDFSLSIVYDEIEEIQLMDELESGTCLSGGTIGDYQYGEYESEDLGEYTLCITSKADNYLLVKRTDGTCAVFNWSGTQDTSALYDGILEVLNGQ